MKNYKREVPHKISSGLTKGDKVRMYVKYPGKRPHNMGIWEVFSIDYLTIGLIADKPTGIYSLGSFFSVDRRAGPTYYILRRF